MPRDYSENSLIQESAARLLRNELGWEAVLAYNAEQLGENGTLGRKSYQEILLARYFREALLRLNPWMTPAQMDEAQRRMEYRLSTASLLQINEEKYGLIRDGIPVTVKKPDGRQEVKYAAVIDFRDPDNNCFLAVKELKIHGRLYRRRTDIVGFVNGIPLLFVELKKNTVDVRDAFTNNYTDYLDTIPQLFYYNAFLILSNGVSAKVGTLGSKYEFFHEWKRLSEREQGSVALEVMLRGICKKENFLDLLENFILFDHSGGRTVKILARNHQYLGVNEAVKAYEARRLRNGRLGVFWHTQGSGKSYSMVFLAQKIRRRFSGSPTIVVLTDRLELNRQISDTFENCGILGRAKAGQFIASDGTDLIEKLRGNPSFIFTLIEKFNRTDADPIIPPHDILIMSDEAHRSQYGIFAKNMLRLLPTASRIGFTGTPLLSGDHLTKRTFGGYISIYDFQRAVDDGATVPLYYENRGKKILHLDNPEITERMLEAVERADVDESQRNKLEREFKKEIHLLTSRPRLEDIARDFAGHYADLWTSGKAMFVCLNKVACVQMYDLVQKYWAAEMEGLKNRIQGASQQEAQELGRKLRWMQETEMAVVVSQEQNEVQTFRKWGLDIEPHRTKMEKRDLDREFKDASNPLRVVFVCAMWLTGFDVKCLSCLYLDKPLKAHALMQAIARANRVAEGKSNGLIIDYIGIVKVLRKALADYTGNVDGTAGADPTVDKEKLTARLLQAAAAAESLLAGRGFLLQDLIDAKDFEKLALLQTAADAVSADPEEKKAFHACASELARLMKYASRTDIAADVRRRCEAAAAIDGELRKKRRTDTHTGLIAEIHHIISEYVQIEEAAEGDASPKRFDIGGIDFALLEREFAGARKKNLVMRDLQDLLRARLDTLQFSRPDRVQYHEQYQAIVEAYNSRQERGAMEKTFGELLELAQRMEREGQRYMQEGFSCDEELAIYEILASGTLPPQDAKAVKKTAALLLERVKEGIAALDHWSEKPETKAVVENLIRDTLWDELPEGYDQASIAGYRQKIYTYIYTRYGSTIQTGSGGWE